MASPSDAVGRRQATVKAKVVLLGEGAVGKTSLVLRYSENRFNDKHEQTLQVRTKHGHEAFAPEYTNTHTVLFCWVLLRAFDSKWIC